MIYNGKGLTATGSYDIRPVEECVNEDNENGDYLLSYHDFEVHLTVVETFLFVAFFVRL